MQAFAPESQCSEAFSLLMHMMMAYDAHDNTTCLAEQLTIVHCRQPRVALQ